MPLAAYCGRAEIMQMVALADQFIKQGPCPVVAVACGLKTLEILEHVAFSRNLA